MFNRRELHLDAILSSKTYYAMRCCKTAGRGGRQVPAIRASSTASTSAARGQPVELSIMLQRVEEKFPESRNGKAFHSYYHCNGKRCSMSDPAYLSSSNGKIAW